MSAPPDPPPRIDWPEPRFELEARPIDRLEPAVETPVAVAALPTRGGIGLVLGGAATLVLGLAAFQAADFVVSQFDRSDWLGGVSLAITLAGFGLIGAGIWRELRGLFALRTVDTLRAEFADPARVGDAARAWLADLPDGPALLPAIRGINDPDAIVALLRAGPAASLQARADALGRVAAMQVFAGVAAVPSPAFDGLLMGWRGARLVREVAELYGMRPGWIASLALLRRTALAAVGVAVTDLAANTLTRAVLSNPLLGHVAGDVAGGGIAARRMMVLARAASAACSPLTRTDAD